MLKYIYIIGSITLLSLTSCENRTKYYENLNLPPEVSLKNAVLNDSVKVSLKSGKSSTTVEVEINDRDKNAVKLNIEQKTGQGGILINNQDIREIDIVETPVFSIKLSPTTLGVNEYVISGKDRFNKSESYTYKITAFSNLNPVAVLELSNPAVNGPYEYEINAGASYDRDAKYGGAISLYTFKIGSQEIEVQDSKIKYNFGKPGNYTIDLFVTDNDGAKSSIVTKTITVN